MKWLASTAVLLGLLVLPVVNGCGGGEDEEQPVDVTLVSGNSFWLTPDPGSFEPGATILLGDNATDVGSRGGISFDPSSIPAGATINSATLRVYQTGAFGGYSLGPVLVDHIIWTSAPGDSFYSIVPESTIPVALSTSTAEGWKELDVTAAFQQDVTNARFESSFRLRHETEVSANGTADYSTWAGASADANKPELVVNYTP
jgi:hypothetical protein